MKAEILKQMVSDGKIKAVIFDMDGTLVDSMNMWHDIDVIYLGRFHIPVPEDVQKGLEGMSMYQTALYFKDRFGIKDAPEKMMDDWNEMAYEAYTTTIPMKPYTMDYLEYLYQKHIPMAVATSNSRVLTDAILVSHNIGKYFSTVITGDDVTHGKPDPEVFLKAAAGLGVDPESCLVFEDLPFGIMAGKAGGMTVCAVEDTYTSEIRSEKEALADCFIDTFSELLAE